MNEEVLALSLAKVDEYEEWSYKVTNEFYLPDSRFVHVRPMLEFLNGMWVDYQGNEYHDIHIDCKCKECTEYTTSFIEDDRITEEDWMKYGEEAYF